ncbi:N-acetyltransferase [Streptomyces albofaciens JCM 4342]|uniref:GNAT family N-acetyltransferase n=1 Tax=Streptomyces albofaciens TaxID=66866 RepID=UPI001239A0BB|nr:GNAT family N-acetyltransferase [Streptomyces albofaciens]KAA6221023.1 N-acetyltransferase [Streptomyces albofaciens JCM 4342]
MSSATTSTLTRLTPAAFDRSVPGLAALLADTVAGGSSLGFTAPFDREAAAAWWRTQRPAVASGTLDIWAAETPEGVMGTISLAHPHKPNARHRAEIVKLLVHPAARGQGLGRALLTTAEQAAARSGFRLLLLDTETDSAADCLYRRAGWTPYGTVPAYAADPGGELRDCTFFYKEVG